MKKVENQSEKKKKKFVVGPTATVSPNQEKKVFFSFSLG